MELEKLRATLGHPNLRWLVDRIVHRIELGRPLSGSVTLRNPTDEQRRFAGQVLGRAMPQRGNLTIQLREITELLQRAGICADLLEAVSVLKGPVVSRRQEATRLSEEWAQVFADAEQLGTLHEITRPWICELEASGLLRRLSRNDVREGSVLLAQAIEIAARLPAQGMTIAELAATSVGDSHALDNGHRLTAIVLRLIQHLTGFNALASREDRRNAWAGVGILCDELSAPVLVLNLHGNGGSVAEQAMRMHARHGEPYRLSTRQLLREPPVFDYPMPNGTVYVCENPSVVADVANRLGHRSAPLICIEGQPKTAAHMLLKLLKRSGVRLLYHGDFDWPGIRIGNLMRNRYGVEPWRFSADDYVAAVKGKTLSGGSVVAEWDPALTNAMSQVMRYVHEEAVLNWLLTDLAR